MAHRNGKRKHFGKGAWNHNTKQKSVEPGLSGLLFTCHQDERRAIAEAYSLIDQLCGFDEKKAAAEQEDDDAALEKECAEMRSKGGKWNQRKQRPTGVKNNLFVSIPDVDASTLAAKLVDLCQKEQRCRFIQRVLPVERTEAAELTQLNKIIPELVKKYLVEKDGIYPTYALDFKARNNDSIKRDNALEMLDDAVVALCPAAKVNLSDPDVTFIVQIVKTTILAGVVHGFQRKSRYALRPPTEESKDAEVPEKRQKLDDSDV
ncbi:unnamed protein product, partial [Mesorhabditis belari]|uniref:THUMP domain-containing protein n=1 Tax=Mesorhabditis belari TaxID=2138241 RepID=A0AAF3FR44_9BILA